MTLRAGLSIAWDLARDFFEILYLLPGVEFHRHRRSLHRAVAGARQRGLQRIGRGPSSRARLQRLIRLVDRVLPGQPNCVRRSLLEIGLDAGAARERLFAGFSSGGGARSGHAWLETHPNARQFDAIVTI